MSSLAKKNRLFLAIQAIYTTKKISIQDITKVYNIPKSSIHNQMKNITTIANKRNNRHQLTLTKEKTLVQYILDLDTQGFPPQICDVKNIANSLLTIYYTTLLDKH